VVPYATIMATPQVISSHRSSAVRPGAPKLLAEAVRETWSRRMLIRYLVRAEMKKTGADTVLGNLWWVFDPLLQLVVYVLMVQVIFKVAVPDYALFVFASILPWKWFNQAVNDSILSVTGQDLLIKQVQFPKIVLPIAAVISGIVHFAFGLIPLMALILLFYIDRLSPFLLLIPVIAAVQFVFTLAAALVGAAVNVFFRDLGNIARHFLRIWFYLSPALYGLDRLEGASREFGHLAALNPFAALFEAYRAIIYGTATGFPTWPDWTSLAVLLVVSCGLVAVATLFFKRLEPSFAKVL
jgi:ABC-type polysaccharide/polyol phosphate export permease